MENLWRLKDMSYRVDLADKAEYDLMLSRFREEERQKHKRDLLYGQFSETEAPDE